MKINETTLGRLAVSRRLITPEQLDRVAELRQAAVAAGEEPLSWGQLLIRERLLTISQLGELLRAGPGADDAELETLHDDTRPRYAGAIRPAPDSTTAAPPPPPAQIGRYQVLEELGRGAMGVVLRARDPRLERDVALKLLSPQVAGDARYIERFGREMRVVARLNHPNVVTIHEVGEEQGAPFYAMELIEGPTLEALVERGRLEPRAAVEMMVQLCRAIDHAHEQAVIHRDIKPANILIDARQRAYITDFGVSRFLEQSGMTRDGAQIGTPRYMAPEQVDEQREVDHRCDVYALGVVLYELLTGRRPFEGKQLAEVYYGILFNQPRDPRALVRGLPSELAAIALHAMAKRPEQRYPTAGAMADDLERWLSGGTVSVRPPGPLRLAWRELLRHRWLAISLVLVLVVLPAALLVQGVLQRQARAAQIVERLTRAEAAAGAGRLDEAVGVLTELRGLAPERQRELDQRIAALRRQQAEALTAAGLAAIRERERIAREEVPRYTAVRDRIDSDSDDTTTYEGQVWGRYALGRHLQRLSQQQTTCLHQAIAAFTAALQHDPELAAPREHLLGIYWERFDRHDRRSSPEADYFRQMLELYDRDGVYRERLRGDGVLALRSEPVATMRLYRLGFDRLDGRWSYDLKRPLREQPADGRPLTLARGSYLALIDAPGMAPTRFPFHLMRNGRIERTIRLRQRGAILPGYRLVTAGDVYLTRGANREPERLTLERDVLVAKHETTFAEYLAFLDAIDEQIPGYAQHLQPRLREQPICVKRDGRWTLPKGDPRFLGMELPVHSIRWLDAARFCHWMDERSGYLGRWLAIAEQARWRARARDELGGRPRWRMVDAAPTDRSDPLPPAAWRHGCVRLAPAPKQPMAIARTDWTTGRSFAVEVEVSGGDVRFGVRWDVLGELEPRSLLFDLSRGGVWYGLYRHGPPAPMLLGRMPRKAGRRVIRIEVLVNHVRALVDGRPVAGVSLWDETLEPREAGRPALELMALGGPIEIHRLALDELEDDEVLRAIDALGGQTRLPSRVELVRAGLGGGMARYPWGEHFSKRFCNNWRAMSGGEQIRIMPGGSFPADRSLFGVYDIAGNLAEWTRECHSRRFTLRGQHGGVYTSGNAGTFAPGHTPGVDPQTRSTGLGMRLVRSLPARPPSR